MTYHPDDPRHDARAILRRMEEFEVIYDDVFDNVRGSILHMQRHIAEAMPAFALMERAGIGSAYGDIDMDEFTALLIMDADGVAHEVAQAFGDHARGRQRLRVTRADEARVRERGAVADLVALDERDIETLLGEEVRARHADGATAHDHRPSAHARIVRRRGAARLDDGGLPERTKGHAWRACRGQPLAGSNPAATASRAVVRVAWTNACTSGGRACPPSRRG